MSLVVLLLALRLQHAIAPEPLRVPRPEINWPASHAHRRQRTRTFRPAFRIYP
jgi:hypothetical protein